MYSSGSAMLPRTLAIASLRQTSRLRCHTGMKRVDSAGRRRSGAARAVERAAAFILCSMLGKLFSTLVAELASCQLDEQILEIRRTMQIAHAGVRREVRQD